MSRKPKDQIPRALRYDVWERDDFTCHYCGRRRNLAIDHKVPESQGGGLELGNLVTSCDRCNSRKGTSSYRNFVLRSKVDRSFIEQYSKTGYWCDFDEPSTQEPEVLDKIRSILKSNPNRYESITKVHPRLKLWVEYWIHLNVMTPDQCLEIIENRRRQGQFREAAKFVLRAFKRFGNSVQLYHSKGSDSVAEDRRTFMLFEGLFGGSEGALRDALRDGEDGIIPNDAIL